MAPLLLAIVGACSSPPKPDTSSPPAGSAPSSPGTSAPATPSASAPATPSASAAATPSASAPATPSDAAVDIKVVSATDREIAESARDSVLDAIARAADKARADAGSGPLRLFEIRPDDILGRLGLKNGDRLEAIEDQPVTSAAIASAKKLKAFRIRVQRAGAPVTLRVTVK